MSLYFISKGFIVSLSVKLLTLICSLISFSLNLCNGMVQICQVTLIKIVFSFNFVKVIIKKQYRNQILRIRRLLTSVSCHHEYNEMKLSSICFQNLTWNMINQKLTMLKIDQLVCSLIRLIRLFSKKILLSFKLLIKMFTKDIQQF